MANMHLVTGHAGTNHVTAADHGSLNAAILGAGQYVLNRGKKLAATVMSNNSIRIADGDIMMQGRHIRIDEGAYVDLTIENGEQGKQRRDLIVCRYTMNSLSGIEEANLVVVKGTAVASNPVDPEYTSADIINDHAFLADMPLYRVPLDGLTVGTLVPLFKNADGFVSKSGDTLNGDLAINKLYPTILLNDSGGKGAQTFIQNANHITWITTRNDIGDNNNYRGIIVGDSEGYTNLKNAAKVVEKTNGGAVQYYNLYGEHNKPTATDVGAPTLESNGRIKGTQACSSIRATTASITLTEADIGKTIICYGSANVTVTVPANIPASSEFEIVRFGTGTVEIVAASGVTLHSIGELRKIKNQYGAASLKRVWTDYDTWLLIGDLE